MLLFAAAGFTYASVSLFTKFGTAWNVPLTPQCFSSYLCFSWCCCWCWCFSWSWCFPWFWWLSWSWCFSWSWCVSCSRCFSWSWCFSRSQCFSRSWCFSWYRFFSWSWCLFSWFMLWLADRYTANFRLSLAISAWSPSESSFLLHCLTGILR